MGRRLAVGDVISFLVVIQIFFFASGSQARQSGRFNMTKLVVRWPPSVCKSFDFQKKRLSCLKPLLDRWTIRGSWPMYWENKWKHEPEIPVPPFNQTDCSKIPPTQEKDVLSTLSRDFINKEMKTYMPDLINYESYDATRLYGKKQWKDHGMCSDHPRNAFKYFKIPIDYMKDLKDEHDKPVTFSTILRRDRIIPDNTETYLLAEIAESIEGVIKVRPEIRCHRNVDKEFQFSEIGICFTRDGTIRRCSYAYAHCGEAPEFREVLFPPAQ